MLHRVVSSMCVIKVKVSRPFEGPGPPRKLLTGWALMIWWSATSAQGIKKALDPMWGRQ